MGHYGSQATRRSLNLIDTNTRIIIRCDKKVNKNNNKIIIVKYQSFAITSLQLLLVNRPPSAQCCHLLNKPTINDDQMVCTTVAHTTGNDTGQTLTQVENHRCNVEIQQQRQSGVG